jgi:MarR family transcriptional regulator, organic hydroperoxide resistance regulator
VEECPEGGELNQEIFDAFAELIGHLLARGEKVAEQFGVPLFTVKALHWLDGGMAMSELGRRMRCDPSFVTAVADSLEKRGLARREPNPTDRRIKSLVLTAEGHELKGRLEREMLAHMPWCSALDLAERKSLLALVRKLAVAEASAAAAPAARTPQQTGGERAGEVIDALSTASAGGC